MDEECTIMVCSCDDYEDLWYPFFKLFYTYWPDCPYRIILNTESKKFNYKDLKIDCFCMYDSNANIPYGQRMIDHIHQVKTPFLLILLEDFFIQERVDTAYIRRIIDYLKSDDKNVFFKFNENKDPLNVSDERFPEFEKRPIYGEYKQSMQAGLWRTEFFLETWDKYVSPWDWEVWGTYRTFSDGMSYYCLKQGAKRPIEYGYDYDNGGSINVYRGKWTHGSYENCFKENDIVVDFSKRGWYSGESLKQESDQYLKKEYRRMQSAGFYMWCKIYLWRIWKEIKGMVGIPVHGTYMDYKRKELEFKVIKHHEEKL